MVGGAADDRKQQPTRNRQAAAVTELMEAKRHIPTCKCAQPDNQQRKCRYPKNLKSLALHNSTCQHVSVPHTLPSTPEHGRNARLSFNPRGIIVAVASNFPQPWRCFGKHFNKARNFNLSILGAMLIATPLQTINVGKEQDSSLN